MRGTDSASIAELLKQHRASAGLTQEELAERATLSARAISDLERGVAHRPQVYTVGRLVEALGLEEKEAARFLRAAREVGTAPAQGLGKVAAPPLPAVAASGNPSGNLPLQPTGFIGRQREIQEVSALLRREDVRLLTLTGPGGVGKTRLALRVAEEVQGTFPDGICFVSLASLLDSALVPFAMATELGVKEVSGQLMLATLTSYFQSKRLLLVLDNFEHLLPARDVVSRLLITCPGLTVLVTSRTTLHLAAEHQYPVPPLVIPTPHHLPDLDGLSRYDAVQLFVQRATAVKPEFRLTHLNAATIAEICYRLDGLPLAIELAAARIRLFSPQALLDRLRTGLQLLIGGPQDQPSRQRTLRNTVDWSYDLLRADEQRLFARLSVFVGGCTLEAIEAVCNPEGEMDPLAGTSSLVEHSLLRAEGEDEPRFRMLETIRAHATDQLETRGEAEQIRRQHGQYFLELVQDTQAEPAASGRGRWLERLEREHENLRAALQWSLEPRRNPETALRLAGGLADFWREHGRLSEGTRWLKQVLALEGTDSSLRVDVLEGAARLAFFHGDSGWAIDLHEEKLALERAIGDKRRIASELSDFGVLAQHHGERERATLLFEESLTLFQELGDRSGIASARSGLGYVAKDQGDYHRATRLLEESLEHYRQVQDLGGMYWTLMALGFTASAQGDYDRATTLLEESAAVSDNERDAATLHALGRVAAEHGKDERAVVLLQESLNLFREVEGIGGMVSSLSLLGRVVLRRGEADRALSLFTEGLERLQEVDDRQATLHVLEGMACTLVVTGKVERAVRLLAATDRIREIERIASASPEEIQWRDYYVSRARGLLDVRAWESAWQVGHAMTLQQAVAHALAEVPS